jgi:TPR repeat protein
LQLLDRGDRLFTTGDLASARLFYERAADAGSGQAALRLGESYDPAFLKRIQLRSVPGDAELAISWYRRAQELGVPEASILLQSTQKK